MKNKLSGATNSTQLDSVSQPHSFSSPPLLEYYSPAMHPSTRRLAASIPTIIRTPAIPPTAAVAAQLLRPIPLLRRILRVHRKALPIEMRVMGDSYLKVSPHAASGPAREGEERGSDRDHHHHHDRPSHLPLCLPSPLFLPCVVPRARANLNVLGRTNSDARERQRTPSRSSPSSPNGRSTSTSMRLPSQTRQRWMRVYLVRRVK